MITADPPARVARILEPVRPYAEEIVIAADSRVDEQTLGEYGAIADKLFRIEYVLPERHLAWLWSQCEGDWILRLDGDEVLSQALVRRLPELLGSRDARQYWIPRAWLYPNGGCVLAEMPWSEDFVNRLMRNDGTLRISGQTHSHPEPVTPREYIDEPIYHLDLLTSGHRQRFDKVVRYEAARSRLLAAGGGRLNEAFYLPEARREAPKLRPMPEEDRAAIARALSGSSAPAAAVSVGDVPTVSLEEMDRMWEGRGVSANAYRASIALREPTLALAPSERRHVMVRVRNEGDERWPASLEEEPQIRLSYRVLNPDGSIHTPEGPRSAFPRMVGPGEQIIAPLHVDAPAIAAASMCWKSTSCMRASAGSTAPAACPFVSSIPGDCLRPRGGCVRRLPRASSAGERCASRTRSTGCGSAASRYRRSTSASAERSRIITLIGR